MRFFLRGAITGRADSTDRCAVLRTDDICMVEVICIAAIVFVLVCVVC